LARYLSVIFQGMAVQAAAGISRRDLHKVVDLVLSGWPSSSQTKNPFQPTVVSMPSQIKD
jgi:hypothetical protein